MFAVEHLIDLVKARPAIYNSTLLEYKSKSFCAILWKEIAEILNRDVSECRSVWTSLRSSYARHLQNMENNIKGINRRKKAPWYLAEKMSFLDDFMLRTPLDRSITSNNYDDANNTTTASIDDNSISFSNLEYKSENYSMDDDALSIVTIKSEEVSEVNNSPLPPPQEHITHTVNDFVREDITEIDDDDVPITSYALKKCRVELTGKDQNIRTPPRIRNAEVEKELPNVSAVNKRFKISSPELALTPKEEIAYAEAREESTLMFFQSILYDLRKLSDRKLRLFKQDILQDLNRYLDEGESED